MLKPGTARIRLNPATVVGRVDERIYGQFLEHIYHSVNGGLWGEMAWDRSFEEPPKQDSPGVSGGWRPYGRGQFGVSSENPLNSGRCQRIASRRGECGVMQSPFFVEKDKAYRGSLFVRGVAGGLVVRLLDGRRVLAEVRPGKPAPRWRRLRFTLRPSATAEYAALQVGIPADGEVWIDQVSLMSDAARRTGGFRPDLLRAIAGLRPRTIRWPGGSFTCWYRWKDGIGPQHTRRKYPMRIWDDQDVNSFGTDEFVALCRRVGAEPVICVSVNPFEPREKWESFCQDARDWVEYCNGRAASKWGKARAANGHPAPYNVRYWEIGNEVWALKPRDYVAVMRRCVAAMKKVDPAISIISCGSGEFGRTWAKGDTAVLSGASRLVDYHSIHHYQNPDKYADGPPFAERYFRRFARRIIRSANPNLKLYISEWNAQSTDWRTGLYAAGILNVFERCSDITAMACPALFLRHVSATGWDNAFINFDHKTWFPAPNYVVMKLWRDHYAPLRIEARGRARPLNGVATKSADGRRVYYKVVNPSREEIPVELAVSGGFPVGRAVMQVVAPGGLVVRNMLGDRDRVRAVRAHVQQCGQSIRFKLPRWSAAAVTIIRQDNARNQKKGSRT